MTSLVFRLNGLQAGKRLLRCSGISSLSPVSTTSSYIPTKPGHAVCNTNVIRQQYHSRQQSGGSSHSLGSHALLLLSFIIGTAAFGVIKGLCQEKEEEQLEDPGKEKPKNVERRNSTGDRERKYSAGDLENAVDLQDAITKAQKILKRKMQLSGAPGLVAAVSVDGRTVWEEGFGKADVENNVQCTPKTVMRIASISKPFTMTALATLMEKNKIDLDAPIQKYVPYFPKKTFDGKEVTITTRHLLSHKSGIRHYKKKNPKKTNDPKETTEEPVKPNEKEEENKEKEDLEKPKEGPDVQKENEATNKMADKMDAKKKGAVNEFDQKEYYIKERFNTIQEAMKLFQDDELFFEPGTSFLYTTHGWTAVSGVVEGAAGKPFTKVILKLFHKLGLNNTYLDDPTQIIYNRGRYYTRDMKGKLLNAQYVDNSYKWAGGGFLSTVQDLTKFGNAMLYASQRDIAQGFIDFPLQPGFLKSSTVHQLWNPVPGTKMGWDRDGKYGLGWGTVGGKVNSAFCRDVRHYASHTGGAIGASSVLLILPRRGDESITDIPPQGVVVALITNISEVGLNTEALQIAKLFENVV